MTVGHHYTETHHHIVLYMESTTEHWLPRTAAQLGMNEIHLTMRKVMQVTEKYPLTGESRQYNRRDLKKGEHTQRPESPQ